MLAGVFGEESLLAWGGQPLSVFVDPDLFPPATIAVPGFLLIEAELDDVDVIYGTFASLGDPHLFPLSVVDVDTIFQFTHVTTGAALVPLLLTVSDIVYAPAIDINRALTPALYVDDDLFGGVQQLQQGKATINQQFPLDTVYADDIIYDALVELVGRTIITRQAALATTMGIVYVSEATSYETALPGLFVDETATLSGPPLGFLSSSLFGSDDAIPAARIDGPIAAALVLDGDSFYAPSLGSYLAPAAVTSADAFFAPFTANQLRPGLITDADNVLGPAVSTPGRMGLVAADDFVFVPTIQFAPLAPALFVDSDSFNTAVIGLPALQPPGPPIDVLDTFYVPVTTHDTALRPTIWIDVDNYLSPDTIEGAPPLQPALVSDSDTIFTFPTISASASMAPGLFSDSDVFYAPTIATAGRQAAIASLMGLLYVGESTTNETAVPGMFVDEGG